MRTVIETPTFQKQADAIWSEDERLDFVTWIAQNPLAGDVIPGADGARKVRWAAQSKGKRGGVRVIYFNLTAEGVVYLVAIYQKSDQSNIHPTDIRRAAQ
ncbi:MAG: type II toxin-antitoxin system RelE/ParE family toxin [Sphingobacterium sp.]|nr:type II toxin-antitoxin system RelE/ParE family toxin [Sphingobacterium sp.]